MIPLKKPLYSALVFFGTVTALTIGYSNYITSLPASVASGSGLTANEWNKMVSGLQTLDTNLSNITFSGGKIGIGTTNPGVLLDIRGVLSAGDSKFYNSIQLTDSFNGTTQSWIWAGGTNQLNLGVGGLASGNTKMIINSAGNVWIGTTSPWYKLTVVGPAADWAVVVNPSNTQQYGTLSYGTLYSGYFVWPGYINQAGWTYGSDRRLKENIVYINNGLEKILQLKPVAYDYISGTKNNLGFIAQDVQSVIPEAVSITDPKTGMLGLKTDFIIPYLVNATKEQQIQIDELKKENRDIKILLCTDHPTAEICK